MLNNIINCLINPASQSGNKIVPNWASTIFIASPHYGMLKGIFATEQNPHMTKLELVKKGRGHQTSKYGKYHMEWKEAFVLILWCMLLAYLVTCSPKLNGVSEWIDAVIMELGG